MHLFESKKHITLGVVALLLANFGVGVGGAYLGANFFESNAGTAFPTGQTVQETVVTEDSAIIDVVSKAQNAVVSVIITKDVPIYEQSNSDPFGGFGGFGFNFPQWNQVGTEEQQVGAGSGFIVSSDGLIITNRHVVEDEEASYSVVMNSGEILEAEVVDTDPIYDLAVMRIDKQDLEYLSLGDSASLKVGQGVIAIGNALGEFSNTVSSGIVSGLNRTVTAGSGTYGSYETLYDIIQTDASINPGNSGGPLLNYAGEVIGVNVAMASSAENIGFAVPANTVKTILDSIEQHGEIVRPYMGIRYMPITKAMQKANNLPYDYGALIVRGETPEELAVIPGGPADKAGLTENDIILEINGVKLDEHHGLAAEIQKVAIGESITLKVYSEGEEYEVSVVLERQPQG